MTQDEIIDMAREARFTINELHCSPPILSFIGQEEAIKAFAKLVSAKKQEDIIQIIKETPFSNWFQADVIEAIRARGDA